MSEKWIRDTGLVFVLISLVFAYQGSSLGLFAAAFLTFSVLFMPSLITPLAWAWQKLAEVLGFVTQRLFFGLVFFLFVTPVGLLRRMLKGDERFMARDKNNSTAFIPKTGIIGRTSLERPY